MLADGRRERARHERVDRAAPSHVTEVAIVKLLLEKGANARLRTQDNDTALDKAAQWSHDEVVAAINEVPRRRRSAIPRRRASGASATLEP